MIHVVGIIALLLGLVLGALIGSMVRRKDYEVISNGLEKLLLISDKPVTFEWIYYRLELTPYDINTLREVLATYIAKNWIQVIHTEAGEKTYGVRVNVLA